MSKNEQFRGFASAVLQELDETIGKEADRAEQGEKTQSRQELANMLGSIIARRAYDLVAHTLHQTCRLTANLSEPMDIVCEDQFIECIPDMSVLPGDEL